MTAPSIREALESLLGCANAIVGADVHDAEASSAFDMFNQARLAARAALSAPPQRISDTILASELVTAAADNGDLNVADSPLYSKALNALRTAHEACFRSADRDVLGMSKGPFSGVNLALGIIKNLEKENTILKSMVLCAEAAIRADEREKCARVAERTPLNSYDAGECRADIAAAIRAGGDING